jgi:hypothetical protein
VIKKRVAAIVIGVLLALCLACTDDVVIDDSSAGSDRDVMIYEAAQNTTPVATVAAP